MTKFPQIIAVLVALSGLLYKLRDLRRNPGNPALRAICVVLACLTGAVVVGSESTYVGLDRLAGVPNLARLIQHALALTAAAAIQVLFLNLSDPHTARQHARKRWAALVVVLIVMAITFALGDFDTEAPGDFAAIYADDPSITWYMLVYLSYLALAMTDILRACVRYARHATGRLLRWGIRLLAAGSVTGLTYVLQKAGFITARRLDLALPWSESHASRLFVVAGITFVTAGLVLPSAGSAVVELARWPRRYRLYRQLRPLWEDVTSAVPEVVLYQQTGGRFFVRRIAGALYRIVIEIHDAGLRLQGHITASDRTIARDRVAAAGLHDDEAAAVIDALLLAVGAARKRARATPTASEQEQTEGIDTESSIVDPHGDADWLARVARAHSHSPIVAEVRASGLTAKK